MKNTIYIGARLNKGEVMPNELFNDRPTELIERLKEKFPLIELLFVPVTDYVEATAEVSTAGTSRNAAYLQTKKGGVE